MELKYGGLDLTFALWELLKSQNVPLPIDCTKLWDVDYLNRIKENHCHFDLENCQSRDRELIWDKFGNVPWKSKILFGEELMIVPLSYFNPDLLRGSVTADGHEIVSYYESKPKKSLPDDPFDDHFIMETAVIFRLFSSMLLHCVCCVYSINAEINQLI